LTVPKINSKGEGTGEIKSRRDHEKTAEYRKRAKIKGRPVLSSDRSEERRLLLQLHIDKQKKKGSRHFENLLFEREREKREKRPKTRWSSLRGDSVISKGIIPLREGRQSVQVGEKMLICAEGRRKGLRVEVECHMGEPTAIQPWSEGESGQKKKE